MAKLQTKGRKQVAAVSPQEAEEDGEYEVEAIVKKKVVKNGRKQSVDYFVKWKNYPSSENSWMKKADLNCAELLEAFEENDRQKSDESEQQSGKSL